jgi:hypothetical protein
MSETHTNNPLLENLRIPGETFTLPSLGMFYDDDVIDKSIVVDGEVHVYPMTALDEIIMRTPDKLFSGKAIAEIFGRCIPGIHQPMRLFAKDVDYLLVCLRKVTYGNEFSVEYKHNCPDAKKHSYQVDIATFLKQSVRIDPTTVGQLYAATLPNGQRVSLRPSTYEDIVLIMQEIQVPKDDGDVNEQALFDQQVQAILSVIKDVDGVANPQFIREWITTIPAGWVKVITDAIEKTTNWGPVYKLPIKCKDCGTDLEIFVPMNPVNLFM